MNIYLKKKKKGFIQVKLSSNRDVSFSSSQLFCLIFFSKLCIYCRFITYFVVYFYNAFVILVLLLWINPKLLVMEQSSNNFYGKPICRYWTSVNNEHIPWDWLSTQSFAKKMVKKGHLDACDCSDFKPSLYLWDISIGNSVIAETALGGIVVILLNTSFQPELSFLLLRRYIRIFL